MESPVHLSRSAVLDGFAVVARQCGLDPHGLLARHAFPPGCLDDPEVKVPTAGVIDLLEDASRLAGEPAFGLLMAEMRQLSTMGAIGLLMREQRDLRSALTSLSRHGWTQIDGLSLVLEVDRELAILSLSPAPGLARSAPQAMELSLAALVRLLRRFIAPDWTPEMVLFDHPKPAGIAAHLRAFGVAPLFSMDRQAIVLRAADLDLPIAGSDPVAARQLERYLVFMAGARAATLAERVRLSIETLLPQGRCRIDLVARQFGVDRRTLHRRLAAEGTSFSALVDAVRQEQLRRHLADHHRSFTEISELLGFSCLSAFSRWKRRLESR